MDILQMTPNSSVSNLQIDLRQREIGIVFTVQHNCCADLLP